jgi:hypothetical protein
MTNISGSPDATGYYVYDPFGLSVGAVGLQALEGNLPGTGLWVENGEPAYFANAGGTAGNIPWLAEDSGNSGNSIQGHNIVYLPYAPNTTKHRPFTSIYKISGTTNIVTNLTDGMGSTMVVDETSGTVTLPTATGGGFVLANGTTLTTTNGIFIKSNGKLNNSVAFDSADGGMVNLSSALIRAFNYQSGGTLLNGPVFDSSSTDTGYGLGFNGGFGVNHEALLEAGSAPNMAWCSDGDSQIGYRTTVFGDTSTDTTNGANTANGGTWNAGVVIYHSFGQKIVWKTANYAATASDYMVVLNGFGSTITNTLPDSTSFCKYREYVIKNGGTSSVKVVGTSSQTIDGASSYTLTNQYQSICLISDGTNWATVYTH